MQTGERTTLSEILESLPHVLRYMYNQNFVADYILPPWISETAAVKEFRLFSRSQEPFS